MREVPLDFMETPLAPRVMEGSKSSLRRNPYPNGEIIEDFLILSHLGHGGMAHVYRAHQISLGREIALKVSYGYCEEAKKMAYLEHEGVVSLYGESYDPKLSRRLLCMQFVPGGTLMGVISLLSALPEGRRNGREILKYLRKRVPKDSPHASSIQGLYTKLNHQDLVDFVLAQGKEMAEALAHAHCRGILHLDLKPSYILLDYTGRAYLTDFNVSMDERPLEKGGTLPTFGGTKEYMAPEQEAVFTHPNPNEQVVNIGAHTDIFALGVILKEILAQAHPGKSTEQAPYEIRALYSYLDRLTQPNPLRRPADAIEVANAFTAFQQARRAFPRRRVFSNLRSHSEARKLRRKALGAIPFGAWGMGMVLTLLMILVTRLEYSHWLSILMIAAGSISISWSLVESYTLRNSYPSLWPANGFHFRIARRELKGKERRFFLKYAAAFLFPLAAYVLEGSQIFLVLVGVGLVCFGFAGKSYRCLLQMMG